MLIYYNTKNMMCGKTLTSFLSSLPRVVVHYCSVASLPLRMILSCHHVTSSEKMRKNGIFQKTPNSLNHLLSFYLKKSTFKKLVIFLAKSVTFIFKIMHKKPSNAYLQFCQKFLKNLLQIAVFPLYKEEGEKRVSYPFFHIFCFSEDVMSTFFFLPSTVLCHFHGELILCPLLSTPTNIMISWIQFH